MLTKLQNFMLLLSFAFLTKLSYIIFCIFFSMSIDIFKNYNILFFIQNSFYPLAIVLGCINLIYTPFSSYLYQKSMQYMPNIRWYLLFSGGILPFKEFLDDKYLFLSVLTCWLIATLCHPNKRWQQKIFPSILLIVIITTFWLGYNYYMWFI